MSVCQAFTGSGGWPMSIFMTWDKNQGREFAKVFDITEGGNFEGLNIPNLLKSNDLEVDFQDDIKKCTIIEKLVLNFI